jgi:proline dehydrogenase
MPKQWPSVSNEELDVKDIEKYYYATEKALRSYYQTSNAVFATNSWEELAEELNFNIAELDKSSALMILATIEAHFRLDYVRRCRYREKDELSRKFRELYKKKGSRASLSDDILELWKKYTLKNDLVSRIRIILNYRHWLAHGRYWNYKQGKKYDFFEVRDLAAIIQTEFKLEMGIPSNSP